MAAIVTTNSSDSNDRYVAPKIRQRWMRGRRRVRGGVPPGYTKLYSEPMKTAVSIPDPVFRAADRLARRLGISRSQLYASALEKLLEAESDDEVTARLDALYKRQPSELEEPLARAQRRAVAEPS